MNQSLFRPEALRQQGERLWGDLLLSQPLSATVLALFLGVVTALALGFLIQHDYARKQTVSGMLVPDRGLIEVRAPATGSIAMLNASLDQHVAAGTPLFTLQLDHTRHGDTGLTGLLLDEVADQQQALLLQRQAVDARQQAQAAQFVERTQLLATRLQQLHQQRATAAALLEIRQRALTRADRLRERRLLAAADYDSVQGQALQQQGVLHELALHELQLHAERAELDVARSDNLLSIQRELGQLDTELADLQKQRLRLDAEQATTVLAPVAGRITSVLRQNGMHVAAQDQVLVLMPDGSRLEAELLLPSSAIGFIRAEQVVKVRYDAFPYQKFGVQQASVRSVAESAVLASRGAGAPGGAAQPVYRVLATLPSQSIRAYGQQQALRPGMALTADVVIDRRSLLEWLLEPLFSIRGKA